MLLHLIDAVPASLTTLSGIEHFVAQISPETVPHKPNLPQPGDVDLPEGLQTKLGILMAWGLRLGYVACFFGFIVSGLNLYKGYRDGSTINLGAFGAVAGGCLIIGSAGVIAETLIF